ncbi:uncharacterized protein ACLA_044540 [Aspergillus clavatus NRRL 1]|uniref:Uncharacterized protein n=1 Tax=Aspergillus clavatus (strain ATCC 1007 / CBS 513.65 / DSM 816 / NCTC 3887 / NRRL 1 / QM 1276 / 107) TaxID=344612 RepID=A1C8U7_ASPCL|nr:uncharacterized protein ACLA_044540 [Aspergillus clavatus NRRL 1]EAW13734.1 hypothetical protein ACLA_044540 [Aspergillus clavatus NRRL 1]
MDSDTDYADFVSCGKTAENRMFEFWADIINGFFPFQANTFPSPAYLFANGASPGEQRACLTAMLSSGALAKIIHLIVAPSPVPDRSAAYAWADKEAELRPALAAAFFALPNREKRGIYGLIAIGDFVRLYEYTLAAGATSDVDDASHSHGQEYVI